MAETGRKTIAFGNTTYTGVAPRLYSREEVILGKPTVDKAFDMLQQESVVVNMAPRFCTYEFNIPGSPAQAIACADFVAKALNSARPEGMMESVASASGAAVRVSKEHLAQAIRLTRTHGPDSDGLVQIEADIDRRDKAGRIPQERNEGFTGRVRGGGRGATHTERYDADRATLGGQQRF